jgi:hypothetical protein
MRIIGVMCMTDFRKCRSERYSSFGGVTADVGIVGYHTRVGVVNYVMHLCVLAVLYKHVTH